MQEQACLARTSSSEEESRSTDEEDRLPTMRCIQRQWKGTVGTSTGAVAHPAVAIKLPVSNGTTRNTSFAAAIVTVQQHDGVALRAVHLIAKVALLVDL